MVRFLMDALVLALMLAGSTPTWPDGAIDPAVSQANIQDTICRREWVRAAQPSVEVTTAIKDLLMAQTGVRYARDYKLDHRVPLCLGGAPLDPRNLQLQLSRGPCNARQKDVLESALCQAVCEGRETLEGPQLEIMSDWRASYRDRIDPKGCE
jgi:hypothetical protein